MGLEVLEVAARGEEDAQQLVVGVVEGAVRAGRELADELGAAAAAAQARGDEPVAADGAVGEGAVAFFTGDDSADLDDVDWVLPEGCALGRVSQLA